MPRGHHLTEAVKDAIWELRAEGGREAEIGRSDEHLVAAGDGLPLRGIHVRRNGRWVHGVVPQVRAFAAV